jgi:putative MATE family efflux protein
VTEALSTRRLLALSASAFGVLAAEPLYLLVDTAVVGHLGSVPLGGLGLAAALMSLLLLLGSFVEYGTTARAARWFGAGDHRAAVNEGVQASWLAVLIGLVTVLLGELLADPLTRLLAGGTGPVQQAAESWFRIAVIGMPMVLLVLAGNGWTRGVQETRRPVVIVLIANGASAIASPILVYPCHLGLSGSAYANVGAQVFGAGLFLRALLKATPDRRLDRDIVGAQLVAGRDLLLRSAGFQVAFLSAAGVAARMGTAQVAAHQIALQLWEFIALLLDSFAIAAQSLVGAALGAGDATNARRTAWQVARYGLIAGVGFSIVLAAGYTIIPMAFTHSAPVIHQSHVLWPWFIGMWPAAGVVFALDGVLIGAGDNAFMRTITMIAAVFAFAPLNVAALYWHWGIGGVWAGLCAFIAVRLVGGILRTRGDRWLVLGTQR